MFRDTFCEAISTRLYFIVYFSYAHSPYHFNYHTTNHVAPLQAVKKMRNEITASNTSQFNFFEILLFVSFYH